MRAFNFSLLFFAILLLFCSQLAQSQTVWSFGFEQADFTAEGAGALTFDQTFDSVTNGSAYIDAAYLSATTNNFLYGGDYHVATGFDAKDGDNFAWMSTSNTCFGFDGNAIGLIDGESYTITFYVAALDPTIEPTTNFSVSPAFENSDGSASMVYGTDEQGAALFSTLFNDPPDTFSDPGWSPAATTVNDKDNLNWVQYTTTFNYSDSMDRLYVSGFGDDGVGTHMAVDSISIEAVPEPSSAILCLGGAMLWAVFGRRRRKVTTA